MLKFNICKVGAAAQHLTSWFKKSKKQYFASFYLTFAIGITAVAPASAIPTPGMTQSEICQLKARADSGDNDASFKIGRFLFNFDEQAFIDAETASRYLKRPAESGNAEAMANYGLALFFQDMKERATSQEGAQKARGLEWLDKAIDSGSTDAPAYKAFYMLMIDQDKNKQQAFNLMLEGYKRGNAFAGYAVGEAYVAGDGVTQDKSTGLKYIREAADRAVPFALYKLGMLYNKGELVQRDEAKAVDYWEMAAERGLDSALLPLIAYYSEGAKNPKKLARWKKQAESSLTYQLRLPEHVRKTLPPSNNQLRLDMIKACQ